MIWSLTKWNSLYNKVYYLPLEVFTLLGSNSNGSLYALTFADAIARYGDDIEVDFLVEVGVAFKGQLKQHFVVLNDSEVYRISRKDQANGWPSEAGQMVVNVQEAGILTQDSLTLPLSNKIKRDRFIKKGIMKKEAAKVEGILWTGLMGEIRMLDPLPIM